MRNLCTILPILISQVKKRRVSDLVGVNIHFKSSTALSIRHRPRFSLGDVLSAVGGNLGLFMGMSIISMVELAGIMVHWH